MKIAITGASGQLGKEIIKATMALTGEDQVIGIARNPAGHINYGVITLINLKPDIN